jgi:hypothetical protein
MFLTLLIVTFVVSTVVSIIVALAFSKPIDQILARIIGDEISSAWRRYVMFALYVAGISNGVPTYDLQQYFNPPNQTTTIVPFTTNNWIFEVYRAVIGTLEAISWVLLIFFIFALLAFVVVRVFEMKKSKKDEDKAA